MGVRFVVIAYMNENLWESRDRNRTVLGLVGTKPHLVKTAQLLSELSGPSDVSEPFSCSILTVAFLGLLGDSHRVLTTCHCHLLDALFFDTTRCREFRAFRTLFLQLRISKTFWFRRNRLS